jgi:hypothetical protein
MCRLVVLSRRVVLMRPIFAGQNRRVSAISAMAPFAIIH